MLSEQRTAVRFVPPTQCTVRGVATGSLFSTAPEITARQPFALFFLVAIHFLIPHHFSSRHSTPTRLT